MKNKAILMASTLAIAGVLTLNSAVFASGVDTTASASIQQKPAQAEQFGPGKMGKFVHKGFKGDFMPGKGADNFDTQLKALVSAGTIDQATADKMMTYLNEKETAMKAEMGKVKAMTKEQRKAYFESQKPKDFVKKDMFSEMVEKGVITQNQADNIKNALQAKVKAAKQEALNARLSKLVEDKTITQDQASKVAAYMQKQQDARQAELEKVKSMTKEERDAYFKTLKGHKVNPLEQLVKDGILTQAQLDSVTKAMHPAQPGRPHGDKGKQLKEFLPKM